MKFELDSILGGILIGFVCPIVGYGIVLALFDGLISIGLLGESSSLSFVSREKTLALFGLCCNLIPFNYFKKKRMDKAMRGVVFPTLFYVGWWLYKYQHLLFG